MKQFLGRPVYDFNTRTYRFADGSGVVPEELRLEMEMEVDSGRGSWFRAWDKRWAWGERLIKGKGVSKRKV